MKLAVVINVGHGPETLKQALALQSLLLDRLGTRLDSIRLAAPRLFDFACAAAVAEKPDILAISASAQSARRAGHMVLKRGLPILFLPGAMIPDWAKSLWGRLSLEQAIGTLKQGELRPVILSVGSLGSQIFFGEACIGLPPHLSQLREALSDASTFGEAWQACARAAQLSRLLLCPAIRFRRDGSDTQRASALVVGTSQSGVTTPPDRHGSRTGFECTSFHYGPLGLVRAVARSAFGGDWRGGRRARFACEKLTIEGNAATWVLLDGDPVRIEAPLELRALPRAIRSFSAGPGPQVANDNAKLSPLSPQFSHPPSEPRWNFSGPSHVAVNETRNSGEAKH